MKRFATAAAVFATPCAAQLTAGDSLVNDPAHIEHINSHTDKSWVAAPQKRFEGLTRSDVRKMLGTRLSHISKHMNHTRHPSVYEAMAAAPSDFDWRSQSNLLHPIRDQQQCGSCWAFSASEVLSDRVAIARGTASPVLSPEDLVSCDTSDYGCQGGFTEYAWKYLHDTGIVTEGCMPYAAGGGDVPECRNYCLDDEDFVRTKAASYYAIEGPVNMQKDIMNHGPVQVAFMVYSSFYNYKSGVYHKLWNDDPLGGHAVKMLGWGVTSGGTAYWILANSWGTNWGEDGYFRIRMGVNECGIEERGPPYAGLAPTDSKDIIVV